MRRTYFLQDLIRLLVLIITTFNYSMKDTVLSLLLYFFLQLLSLQLR